MEIRCVAQVMRKVHNMADQTFKSLAEIGCTFHEKLVDIVGKDRAPSLPKVWSKGKPQRDNGSHNEDSAAHGRHAQAELSISVSADDCGGHEWVTLAEWGQ